ncbi:protein TRANSPORT INHIBITOR RESPONSE 1 [Physcomitrium patens]|uniref:F-box domain-containing protein n=1 Tax=Physcomitrium patens TaxID=3218 RepID=A0A2K1IVK2_PHYPA|nr:protein TRANSPORT INHIBITOR RESPONSE 1-like [Physcomitrium patens]XP_024357322.1 protein TRANSPORT INHIBITOR RESPONSE 1-like [Physcomitrium patens]XP_024357324.1 protein TRANSPORT INHIBITOR RESPONSE 1-like [Physcomitrium patens]XP_024357325.1 protein TRANSPORT INHIBITOR RESPONSE 1-like [Physcomitrium patens]XP_024357326.1 protein TRANSPORT INHIBITOR RESPONSE 1-like [Physcomitrium patens]XP_024357327.1 protein TRANSPORT INHIBITOR RESPONSE 1-like [Physcomitrium patens]PNR33300.1 hypothetical|eukprot:XP_024357321.1 protein TRANSPORT INHIBITOR RESPONSE 1-like [Physcomitrella patens]
MPPSVFPDEVLEHVLVFLDSHKDRNSVSLVCKSWYKAEGWSRRKVFIGNCYAVSSATLIRRFPKLVSLEMKGRPRFTDFGLVPQNWGGFIQPWIQVMAEYYPGLEGLKLKRMTVSDESLRMIAVAFPNFRSLRLTSCDGFSTDGITEITKNCRNLAVLDLQENYMDIRNGDWLKAFPESLTSLESLNFATVKCAVDEEAFQCLEALVARCRCLKTLKVNKDISLGQLRSLLLRAPQLEELGTGIYNQNLSWGKLHELQGSLKRCKNLRSLSGLWEVIPMCLPTMYPVCLNLTSLDLSNVTLMTTDFTKFISYCTKVRRLLVQDFVGDKGLAAAAFNCKELQELRVYPVGVDGYVTEQGFIAISKGCPELRKILYFCKQMTNAAMVSFAQNCPKMTHFRLCIMKCYMEDCETGQPLDEGFGAVCRLCVDLRRLSLSGKMTDKTFEYIGQYAKKLEMLSVAFAGDSDDGMQYVLDGCPSLRKLEVRDCPFGDEALLTGIEKYESMRSLWMSSCHLTRDGCQFLASHNSSLNVEIIKDVDKAPLEQGQYVEKLYVYRTIAGPRADAPHFVETL